MWLLTSAQAQAPSVITDHATYLPGETIVVFFKNGPGNRKDWIGLYPEGIVPGTGTPSTRWYYVDNTQAGNQGLKEGAVTFTGGLNLAGDWVAFLLLNDEWDTLAQVSFRVADPTMPLVRTDKRVYAPGEKISITFTNGPANPKDWIGVYPADRTPGAGSLLWMYADGTTSGNTGKADGTISFANGLPNPGDYVVYLLSNDTYDGLANEPFTVSPPTAKARLLGVQPADGATGVSPKPTYTAVLTNGTTKVVAGTITLQLDSATVNPVVSSQGEATTVSYLPPSLLASESRHVFELTCQDNATPPNEIKSVVTFTVGAYRNIVLPAPLYFENFDQAPEGQLPAGWTEKSHTEAQNPEFDLGNLDSASYATWTVVNAERFQGSFVTYSDPANPPDWGTDYHRVLSVNPLNVVNGVVLNEPLAKGRFVFGNSGYRNGRSQVLYLFTPDFDLTGKHDVFLSFHSLWEQNQDSFGAVEYSIDGGATWLPVVYMVDAPDVLRDPQGNVDAVATLTAEYADAARYLDPDTGEEKGGSYGAFVGAEIGPELGAFISPRVNDDPVESKRVELFRLPQADNRQRVRVRFAHAGTDSWYFGVDDFGLYSIPTVKPPTIDSPPSSLSVYVGDAARLSVTAGGTGPFAYQWSFNGQPILNATNAELIIPFVKTSDAGNYLVRVANAAGAIESPAALLTTTALPNVVAGVWNFDQGDLTRSAGVGLLEFADGEVTEGLTSFETTDGAAVPHINGQPAKYMRVPAFAAGANGYNLTMPTVPVGNEGYLNRYTMIWDVLVPGDVNWTPLFNTNPGNANDADFYVSDAGALGIGALGYSANGVIEPTVWRRVAFAANLVSGRVTYYVNGLPVRVRTGGSLAEGRFALYSDKDAGPDLRLFNEPTGNYTHELLVNSFGFISRTMADEEILALGGPAAAGISLPVPAEEIRLGSPTLSGGALVLVWTGGLGPFQVQKTTALGQPWQNVGSPTNDRTFSEPLGSGAAFYRVIGQ
jgi:hypothetical protein